MEAEQLRLPFSIDDVLYNKVVKTFRDNKRLIQETLSHMMFTGKEYHWVAWDETAKPILTAPVAAKPEDAFTVTWTTGFQASTDV